MAVVRKQKSGSSYLERHAKTYINDEIADVERISKSGGWKESYCGQYAKVGKCENDGRQYLKIIYCNKEWCENCREQAHNRRIARWLPKALTMPSFGYFIFTIPPQMRQHYQEKKNLSQLRSYLRRRLKQIYPDIKALCRWHWFGENPYVYHPHLNVMVSSFEKLPKEELERIKEDYKKALERFTGIKLDKKVDVYYHYYSPEGFKKEYGQKHKKLTDEQAQELYRRALWHKLRYITKATFVAYQKKFAEKLKGYRNSVVWGRFPELSYEEIEELAKQREAHTKISQDLILLESGHCPICGGKIRWLKGLYPGSLSFYGKDLGNGYFELPIKIRGSPRLPSRKKLEEIRHYRWLLKNQYWLEEWLEKELERKDIYD